MPGAPTCYRHPDRETYVSCSECGRPICYECMTPAPVGQRRPEHSGRPQGVQRITKGARRGVFEGSGAIVTKTLVGLNIAVYVITAAQGAEINSPGGSLFAKWVLFGPAVANGDWWRLITSSFLHASLIHIAFNMYFLWFVGAPVEMALGHAASGLFTSSPGWRAPPAPSSIHRLRPRSGPQERSSGSSARRSCSSVSATTCSAAPRSRSC